MKPQQFDKLANEAFGGVLAPAGFSNDKSRYCTFYREVSDGFYHIVMPDLGTRGAWYDVKVFAYSSCLTPRFEEIFPDDLGIPTDIFCHLGSSGIGPDPMEFNCKNEENFRRRFTSTVAPLLESVAIPYLEQFQTLNDLLPEIRSPLSKALATHYVLGREAGHALLEQQRERLGAIDSDDAKVVATLQLIDELLSPPA